jgi:DNA-binding XRE family transcriptional regulator
MDGQGATAFGDLLRRFRDGAGLTQEELAERAGLSSMAISLLERGERRRSARNSRRRPGARGRRAPSWCRATRRPTSPSSSQASSAELR